MIGISSISSLLTFSSGMSEYLVTDMSLLNSFNSSYTIFIDTKIDPILDYVDPRLCQFDHASDRCGLTIDHLRDATHYATEIPAMRRLCDRLPVDTVFIDHAPDVNVVDSSRMVHLEQQMA